MSILGGVSVYGFIAPSTTGDTYAVIDPIYGIDGFRNVNSISEMNAIPNERRRAGMQVGVNITGETDTEDFGTLESLDDRLKTPPTM